MTLQIIGRMPGSLRTFAVALAVTVFAFLSVIGPGMARTDSNVDIPAGTVESMCPTMEILFHSEGRWLVANQPFYEVDDPVMVSHRIQYWNYWHFLETWCGGAPVAH